MSKWDGVKQIGDGNITPPPLQPRPILTPEELELLDVIADLYGRFRAVVGTGPSRPYDLQEIGNKIHELQAMVMSQAAARQYPDRFRLLGESS